MAIALWWFWLERGYLSDGHRWVDALLALDGVEGQTGEAPHKLPARTKAYLLRVSGILAMAQGDHDRAVTLYKEAISAYRELGHKKGVSATLRDLGFVAYEKGDYERAVGLQELSLALACEFGIVWSMRALADAVRVVEAWHEALNEGEVDRLVGLSHPDVEVGAPRGTRRVARLLREWVDRANVRLAPRRLFGHGDTVVVEQAGRWRSAESGEAIASQTVASVLG